MECPQCQCEFFPETSRLNRAAKIGAPLYCGKECAGLARRTEKPSEAERKAAKATYDRERRERLVERIKEEKAAYYQRTRDPEKERVKRAANMHKHVEYCRSPEYKIKKAAYDRRKRFEAFGPFAEAAMLLEDLEREISSRATRYEIYIANGRFTRSAQQRWRELWQLINRKT
jgi:hypothetical protein